MVACCALRIAQTNWRTYSRVIKNIGARIIDLVRRDKYVSWTDLVGVDFLDVKDGRVDVWSL